MVKCEYIRKKQMKNATYDCFFEGMLFCLHNVQKRLFMCYNACRNVPCIFVAQFRTMVGQKPRFKFGRFFIMR